MTEENEKKKSDEEILFPNIKVGDLVIKPWSFGTLFKISPYLDSVLLKAESRGLIEEFDTGQLNMSSAVKLFAFAASELLDIICISIEKEKEYVESLGMVEGIKLVIAIYNQNLEIIKNGFALLTQSENKNEEEEKAGS